MGETTSFSIFLKDYFSKSVIQAGKNSDKVFDSIEKNLDEVDQKAKKTGKSLESSLGGAFKGIGGLVATLGVTLGVTAGIMGAAKLGIQAEQTNVAFTTMIGSAELAKKTIADLSAFAAATPYGKKEVLDAGKQFLAYGFSADEIKSKLTNIGDVASGLGQPLGDMAYLFGTIKTQGKAMTMDLNQFANRGVPIFEEVAKVMGISQAAVKDYAAEGKISYAVIEKAFANMSGKGGKFFNMMESQSQTAGGRISTMMDNLAALGEKIGIAMLPAINSFVSLGSILLETLVPAINVISIGFKWIGENLKSIVTVLAPLMAIILAFKAWAMITKMVTIAQAALNAVMSANPIGLVVAGIALLIGGLILAWEKSEMFRGVILGLWEVMKEFAAGIGNLFSNPFETLKRVFTGIVDFFKKQIAPIFEMIQAIKEGRWMDAAKAGGKLLFNLTPVGLAVNVGKEIVNSDAFKRGFEKGKDPVTGEPIVEPGGAPTGMSALAANAAATGKAGAKVGDGLIGVAGDQKASKNLTIRIDKLVEHLNVSSVNMKEGSQEIQRMIQETLINAVRDVETSY